MSIEESTFFKVVNTEQQDDKPPKISLRYTQTNNIIETIGTVLEAQFIKGDKYVLFISEGTPYEEALHILLIDSALQIIDSIELSAEYTPGMLRDISMIQPNKIHFSFFSPEEVWCLEVVEKPRTQLWGNKYPVKRQSPFFHKVWLVLEKP